MIENLFCLPLSVKTDVFQFAQFLFFCFVLLFHTAAFFSSRTFNPADYSANAGARQEAWEGDGNEAAEEAGKENSQAYTDFSCNIYFLVSTFYI